MSLRQSLIIPTDAEKFTALLNISNIEWSSQHVRNRHQVAERIGMDFHLQHKVSGFSDTKRLRMYSEQQGRPQPNHAIRQNSAIESH
jgi:hypothetical protein